MSPEAAEAIDSFYLAFWCQTLLWSWALSAMSGAVIGESKDRKWAGFALGLLLGPLGVLAACFLSPSPERPVRYRFQVVGLLPPTRGGDKGYAARRSARNGQNSRRLIVCPRCSADLYPSATAKAIRCEICRSEVLLPAMSH